MIGAGSIGTRPGAFPGAVVGLVLDTPDAPCRMSRADTAGLATVDPGTTLNPPLNLRVRARSSWKAS